jgi:NADPH:quinone reductase-like Zn-dependent oxidoreductase
VAVVNPSQFKVISQSVKKTDKNDAELLALYLAKGLLPEVRQILPIDLPWIPGHEFSGVVEQVGSDVEDYAPMPCSVPANTARKRSF